jgi:hypothetical protein
MIFFQDGSFGKSEQQGPRRLQGRKPVLVAAGEGDRDEAGGPAGCGWEWGRWTRQGGVRGQTGWVTQGATSAFLYTMRSLLPLCRGLCEDTWAFLAGQSQSGQDLSFPWLPARTGRGLNFGLRNPFSLPSNPIPKHSGWGQLTYKGPGLGRGALQ